MAIEADSHVFDQFILANGGLDKIYVLKTSDLIGPGLIGIIDDGKVYYSVISDDEFLEELIGYLIKEGVRVVRTIEEENLLKSTS